MPYPDGTDFRALDRATGDWVEIEPRALNANEMAVIASLELISHTIAAMKPLADRIDHAGGDGESYLQAIAIDGGSYCDLLIAEIKAGPEREALAQARLVEMMGG